MLASVFRIDINTAVIDSGNILKYSFYYIKNNMNLQVRSFNNKIITFQQNLTI